MTGEAGDEEKRGIGAAQGMSTPLWPWCLGLLIYGDQKLQYLDDIYALRD